MIAEPITQTRKIWTYDEVAPYEIDGVRRELHDGEIYEMPSPTLLHQTIVGQLYFFLRVWAQQNGGKPIVSPIDLYVSSTRYYIPDLVFYSAQTLQNGDVSSDGRKLTVAPDLVIEVLSDSTARNDRVTKVNAYAAFGITHYWLVDPRERTLEALELRNGFYSVVAALSEEETFAPASFPGFSLELERVFEM
jgi:Uma2 family endonuclease